YHTFIYSRLTTLLRLRAPLRPTVGVRIRALHGTSRTPPAAACGKPPSRSRCTRPRRQRHPDRHLRLFAPTRRTCRRIPRPLVITPRGRLSHHSSSSFASN